MWPRFLEVEIIIKKLKQIQNIFFKYRIELESYII